MQVVLHKGFESKQVLEQDQQSSYVAILASLSQPCDRFAAWRWKTLGKVTADLLRMAEGVCLVVHLIDGDVFILSVRDKTLANKFLSAVSKEEFWDLTQAFDKVAKPLTSLSGWIRGCACHEGG